MKKNVGMPTHKMMRNLVEICDTLQKKGKQVCLATVASADPTSSKRTLRLYCSIQPWSNFAKAIPVVFGPRLDTYAFCRITALSTTNTTAICSCTLLMELHSYRQLARHTADFLIPMITAVEWTTWKTQLGQVTYDKALYD
ncbi:hypothetical protein CCR75_001554 [Bremia lactucae]|uniref:Uncharacterized protein n=1 Tax=Bremia lactucae TaxID=4779 RepID=A0A976FEJ3_BRELC|nr:hypothetical protein CCR75_001554 [Bremia lactucae]